MQWLQNLRMKKKLLLLIALPLLLSLGFASQALINNYERMKEATRGKAWNELIIFLDELTDNLQEEGRLSIEFTHQKDSNENNRLLKAREKNG